MPNLFFIPGLSRCGTTWVTDWLTSHYGVAATQESYLARYAHMMLNHEPPSGRIVERQDVHDFLMSIYTRVADGRPWLVDKSPGSLVYKGVPVEQFLLDLFPGARVLLFYRDGKDYVYAFKNVPWEQKHPPTVESGVANWKANAQYLLSRKEHPSVMTVRYEELLSRPVELSEQLTKFLGLELTVPLAPWERPINTLHSTLVPQRWSVLMEEHRETLRTMNPLLEQLGYDPVP